MQRGERLRADRQVDGEVSVPQVPEVVREPVGGALGVGGVVAAELRPARDAGLDQEAASQERNRLLQHANELRPLRARADDRHLALEHVPELRQLVEVGLPEKAADAGHARVVLLREDGPARLLCVLVHRPELVHREEPAALAHPGLPVNHAAGVRRTSTAMNGTRGAARAIPKQATATSSARFVNRLYVR